MMKKIIAGLTFLSLFLAFYESAFAVQDFDYYFGTLLLPTQKTTVSVSSSNASNVVVNSPNLTQISSIQANLNQMKATLASLNSNLVKPQKEVLVAKSNSVIARGIPLLLPDEIKKEKKVQSVFASLIPPDVRNFPFIATHLIILTLGLLGVIVYLFFLHHKEKKQLRNFVAK